MLAELVDLRWDQVEFRTATLHVRRVKSGSPSTHPILGDELRSLRRVKPIVRHHHERLDGSGYPDRLKGDAIPLFAQIMGIVDVFDALTTARPYKPALTAARAYEELQIEVSRGWRRADLVEQFERLGRENRLPRVGSRDAWSD